MDDIEIVRRAMRSSLVSSAPEKLAALDRIEARLKAAEAGVVQMRDKARKEKAEPREEET